MQLSIARRTDNERRTSESIASDQSKVDGRVIDELVSELNSLKAKSRLEMALQMGKVIVERFYGNDLRRWRRHLAKEISFRQLAARSKHDLRVSATFLYRAVALYELTCRIGTRHAAALTMTHLRTVLGLPEQDQTTLLEAAATNQWSTERLQKEAAVIRATALRPRGRPATPPLSRAVKKLGGACSVVEEVLSQENAVALSGHELDRLHRAVGDIHTRVEKAVRRLVNLRERPIAHSES